VVRYPYTTFILNSEYTYHPLACVEVSRKGVMLRLINGQRVILLDSDPCTDICTIYPANQQQNLIFQYKLEMGERGHTVGGKGWHPVSGVRVAFGFIDAACR
jgi:hypothetical protein